MGGDHSFKRFNKITEYKINKLFKNKRYIIDIMPGFSKVITNAELKYKNSRLGYDLVSEDGAVISLSELSMYDDLKYFSDVNDDLNHILKLLGTDPNQSILDIHLDDIKLNKIIDVFIKLYEPYDVYELEEAVEYIEKYVKPIDANLIKMIDKSNGTIIMYLTTGQVRKIKYRDTIIFNGYNHIIISDNIRDVLDEYNLTHKLVADILNKQMVEFYKGKQYDIKK